MQNICIACWLPQSIFNQIDGIAFQFCETSVTRWNWHFRFYKLHHLNLILSQKASKLSPMSKLMKKIIFFKKNCSVDMWHWLYQKRLRNNYGSLLITFCVYSMNEGQSSPAFLTTTTSFWVFTAASLSHGGLQLRCKNMNLLFNCLKWPISGPIFTDWWNGKLQVSTKGCKEAIVK